MAQGSEPRPPASLTAITIGSAKGAMYGVFYGALAGEADEGAVIGAIVGGAVGMGIGAREFLKDQDNTIEHCLREKGYVLAPV